MLRIDRLRLRVPAGCENRAGSIAQATAKALATAAPAADSGPRRLAIHVQVQQAAADSEVAAAVAARVARALKKEASP